ncbi:MAG: hypothetical protein NDI69_05695 [Bacteriovoracaceae bacterium]|nr:hypothetical protein [Bacteriovoracaceae bacterium]
MKKLILFLLSTTSLWAVDEIQVLSDAELNKKLITTIKEVEVTTTLENSTQFRDCRKMAEFDPKTKATQAQIDKAIECFKKKMPKDTEGLASLSDNLGLQKYGLVASKSQKELTEYLSDKMYQSLTGVDRKEKNLQVLMDNMKFGKMKMVDQSVFIDLYTTQLVKNSLFEVSRFCFENFRNANTTNEADFISHWGDKLATLGDAPLSDVTDTGSKGLGNFTDIANKDAIYKNILEGMGANDPNKVATVATFFENCSKKIVPICKEFEDYIKANPNADSSGPVKGANACLTKAKLQASRKAIADANKIQNEFRNSDDFKVKMSLLLDQKSATPQFYNPKQDSSIDELTNYSSRDILEGGATQDKKLLEKQEKCAQDGSGSECEDFVVIDDSRAKAEHELDLNLRFKKETELARLKKLQETNNQDLEEYLKENGYLDILEKYKANKSLDVAAELSMVFDAKRVAALAEMKAKLGKRQMTEAEASQGEDKKKNIEQNAQDSKEERARMAQVILFNNIITGHLTLRKKETQEVVGRNVNVLKKEVQGLEEAKIDENLFANLKSETDSAQTNNGEAFAGAEILDGILGAKDEEKKSK